MGTHNLPALHYFFPSPYHEALMKQMQLYDSAGAPQLVEAVADLPLPAPNEILLRVHAAGVIPTEVQWYPTTHRKDGTPRSNAVPSHEFSGTVFALGEGLSSPRVGAEIFGMNDWFAQGAIAEYCLTSPQSVAAKPPRLSHAEAASVPIGALTAWQGLLVRAAIQPGDRVLIHGAAGGVGVFAVQLARWKRAEVTATASAENLDFVLKLGAHHVLDYHKARFDDFAQHFDIVFDAVGGETLDRSWALLKPNGRMITVAAGAENSTDTRVKQAFFIVEPNQSQLIEISQLLQSQILQPVVDAILPFSQAPAAYRSEVPNRQRRGRLVISLAP